jgi:hypothetical protein
VDIAAFHWSTVKPVGAVLPPIALVQQILLALRGNNAKRIHLLVLCGDAADKVLALVRRDRIVRQHLDSGDPLGRDGLFDLGDRTGRAHLKRERRVTGKLGGRIADLQQRPNQGRILRDHAGPGLCRVAFRNYLRTKPC